MVVGSNPAAPTRIPSWTDSKGRSLPEPGSNAGSNRAPHSITKAELFELSAVRVGEAAMKGTLLFTFAPEPIPASERFAMSPEADRLRLSFPGGRGGLLMWPPARLGALT